MIVSADRGLSRPTRDAFTLLEVLIVVAILVILASVATISMFKYYEDAKVNTARSQMTVFEQSIKNYMAAHDGVPPQSLEEIVAPQDGSKPALEGGLPMLLDPWGAPYQYNPGNVDNYNNPDPIVSTTDPGNKVVIYSNKRPK